MRSQILPTALPALAGMLALASAWQAEIHNQIGYMADEMLEPNAKFVASTILEPKYQGSLGRAAGWADTVSKSTHKYSYTWHWISAQDNPPDVCGLYYHRDCQATGCVVQQINNQTQILERCIKQIKSHTYQPQTDCQQALMWVIHFIEDVAQPMHTSGRALGGNLFPVKFGGKDTNMHQIWDKHIFYSQTNHSDGFLQDTFDPYFKGLLARIHDDSFRQPRDQWAMCDFDARRGTYCPELWAKDTNAYVCDYAYGRYKNNTDLLDSGYAAGALSIVEQQVAKAAFRLSGWLNALADRTLGLGDGDNANLYQKSAAPSHRYSREGLSIQRN